MTVVTEFDSLKVDDCREIMMNSDDNTHIDDDSLHVAWK